LKIVRKIKVVEEEEILAKKTSKSRKATKNENTEIAGQEKTPNKADDEDEGKVAAVAVGAADAVGEKVEEVVEVDVHADVNDEEKRAEQRAAETAEAAESSPAAATGEAAESSSAALAATSAAADATN
jgi:hypothetical protein